MVLLVLSFTAVLPVARASASSVAPQAQSYARQGIFSPQYIILGQLEGNTLVQSLRPRSVPLVGGVQFAATYYTAQDMENAYGANGMIGSGFSGKGETIAIIDAYGDPEISQDIASYDSMFRLPAANLTIIPVGPYNPTAGIGSGWDVETALDVEAAHAMAPYAHINLLIAANSSNALLEAIKMVVTQHLGNVVSMSWGGPENLAALSGFTEYGYLGNAYADYYFSLGAAEGISFFSSTGDGGAYDTTTTVSGGASFPATSPFVTAVGGTTLFMTPTSGYFASLNSSSAYVGESAWSISPQYVGAQVSSGGGVSTMFAQPYYQQDAIKTGFRTVPDVSADANPYTGFIEVLEGATEVIGGTSLSSPLWAGMAADLDQYVGSPLGSLNPVLYSIYGNKTAYADSFHQVNSGYNGGYLAGGGYNLVTGMGSPNLPALAAAIKSEAKGLSITVSSSLSSIGAQPQYYYGDTFTVSASINAPSGASVSTGSFTAILQSVQGQVSSLPLTYNGTYWVGSYTVGATDPPNEWTVEVTGSSGGLSGYGITDVDVGGSIAILSPIPYPYSAPLDLNVAFFVAVSATFPNGSLIPNLNLTAYFIQDGTNYFSAPLTAIGGGLYAAYPTLATGDPQGTYTMVVNGTSFGSVYEYLYFGDAVVGVMLTPNNDALPSAAVGQQVTFLAETYNSQFMGQFTSNVTANVYNLKGGLMASVKMKPAPDRLQFGVDDFFEYQQANYTIPDNFTQGFYRLEFLSQYYVNSTFGSQLGNFTTGFYVSGPTLQYTVSTGAVAFEGQYVKVTAKIVNASGSPVTAGIFFATLTPSGYAFEAGLTDLDGVTGLPMQYSPSSSEWLGYYRIPSALTPFSELTNLPGFLAGPWTVFVSGESMSAENVVPTSSYLDVLPYTYESYGPLTPSSILGAPLVAVNGTGYVLEGAASSALSVSGVSITLADDWLGTLTATNSTVYLTGSRVGSIDATGSTLVVARDSAVGSISLTSTTISVSDSSYQSLSPALPTITVSGLSQPINGSASYTVTVLGQQLLASSVAATIDGSSTSLSVTSSAAGLTATGTVDSSTMSDGVHALTVTAAQQDGMSTSVTVYFSTDNKLSAAQSSLRSLGSQLNNENATVQSQKGTISSLSGKVNDQNATISSLTYGLYALGLVAIVALAVAIVAVRRKEPPASTAPASTQP